MSDAWQPDVSRRATLQPLAQRRGHHAFPVLRAVATRLLRTGPER
jgi:hypothetical protein